MKKIFLISSIAFMAICATILSCSKVSYDSNTTTAKVGSLARFGIAGNRLYIVDSTSLTTVNISNPSAMSIKGKFEVGSNIETIFPFGNKLFIGSASGMYAYDITNPDIPSNKQFVEHITGCDPVVANDSAIFVTVSLARRCNLQLSSSSGILAFSYYGDINNIQPTASNFSQDPQGLALHKNMLYVCDGEKGIECYNTNNNGLAKRSTLAMTDSANRYVDLIEYNTFMVAQTALGIRYLTFTTDSTIAVASVLEN